MPEDRERSNDLRRDDGPPRAGDPSTNDEPVPDGLEGSINAVDDASRRARGSTDDRESKRHLDDV